MNESLLNRLLRAHKRQRRMLVLILCLSMIVSLGTFAGFHKNAIAKVYTREVLDCPFAHEGAEPVAHTHNDDCYEGDLLVCTLPEREAHMHSDGCYTELQVLLCTLEENAGHQHTEECYDEDGELICQIPEGEGAHVHTDDCYTIERALICELPELRIHVHDAGCFRTEEITVDEPEETVVPEQAVNTVPEMPVSDPNADLETAEDWNREFENFELSGNWARDLILVAATQQGHGESPNNFEAVLNDAGDAWVKHGYTRYGAWYGVPYAEEWSAMFVSFCLRYAGIPAENVPNNPSAAFMAESFSLGELFAGRDYVPATGDLIFFGTMDDMIVNIDHMGIVYHVDAENGIISTVEGDRTDAVATFGYYLNDEQIVGYGILPQNPNYIPAEGETEEEIEKEFDGFIFMTMDEEEELKEAGTVDETTDTDEATVPAVSMPAQSWERTAGGIKVTVEAPEGAFPENTRITVTPVNGSSLMDTVSDAVDGAVLEVQAVDITFFDADGHEIEPAVPIRVVMTPAATEHAEEKTSVVHVDIAQQTAELIEQAEGTEDDNSEVVFDAESFTIYAIVYSVDFEYEVNGKVFTSSMPGAEDIPLSEIVKGLGIVNETEIDTFVSKIVSITSTNEEVAVVTGNGEIRVLKDGEAQIVISMQDGAKFEINVKAEGETSVEAENVAISTVGELYLPAGAGAKLEIVENTDTVIEAVQNTAGSAEATMETSKTPNDNYIAETMYQVYDIQLDNVDPGDYMGFQVSVALPENIIGRDFHLYHIHDGETADITTSLQLTTVGTTENGEQEISDFSFYTEDFSEFVLQYTQYTVDFHYIVNGKTYDISIPGGGFVSFAHLAEVLGLAYGNDIAIDEATNPMDQEANSMNSIAIDLNAIPISTETKNFVSHVTNITFSNPSLVWTGRVEEMTTVGDLKELNDLDIQYSYGVTEENIHSINAQLVEAGDWVLISLMPFDTEESLTITLDNNDSFTIQVTDAQISTRVITADGQDFIITVTYGREAEIPDGATLEAREVLPETEEYNEYIFQARAKLCEETEASNAVIQTPSVEESDEYFDAEAVLVTLNNDPVIAFARFFDISIMAEGEEIEPKAPVEVSISYADPIAVEEGAEAEVIHFAESGIEMLQTETDSEIQQGEQISTFEYTQDSFSVTGTLLKYTGSVASGKYLIIVASGKAPDTKYYALNANGDATQITRNSDNVTFANVPDNCQWEFTKVNDNGTYNIQNVQNGSNLVLYNGNVLGGWTQGITITPNELTTDDNGKISGRNRVTLKNNGVATYLGWSYSNFVAIGTAQQVYLARINTDIDRQGQTEVPLGETDLGDLSAWKERITSSKFDADKTAQVHNYDQRIYEVDIKASSNMLAILPSIDLELIVDTSRSMFFPATLNAVPNTTFNNEKQLVNLTNSGNLDQNQIYYFVGGGEAATVYALYYGKSSNNLNDDADTPKWRYVDASYMNPPDGENQKFTDWLNKMEGKNIEDFGVGGTSETLNVPGQLYTSPDGISRFAYLKEAIRIAGEIVYAIDSNARIGLVTFNKEAEAKGFFDNITALNNGLGNITLAGGTQQDKGLSIGQQMFNSSGRSDAQKIAVLITDGAPNQTNWTNITTAADNLKNSGVTLYTLGLSLDMVGGNNKTSLANIVTGGDSVRRAYAAENGPEIAAAVKALIESLVRQADVVSTVTDTIDLAYCPVTKDGTPLKDGDYIDLQGNLLLGMPESGNDYGKISYNSGSDSYSVTWEHQRIHYEDENSSSSGWDGKFYVKAKENFLGGNTIKTNSNTNADKIQAETMIVTDPNTHVETRTDISDKNISIEFETPIVNVKELELTGHDATWTLYVGAEVTDDQLKQQVSNLFNNIEVHEIVTEEGKPIVEETDVPVSFKLKELVGGDLTESELNKLIAGESVTRNYSHYGHENIGSITINLVRETKENGDTEYKISATYASNDPLVKDPDTGEVINWHNGPSGPGRWMNPIHSNNTQTVDDYYLPNSFKIEKVNGSGNAIADSPALFKLYRKTKDGDPGTPVPLDRYDPNNTDPYLHNNQFTSIETAHTINGIANIGGLLDEFGKTKDESLLLNAADGPYYLIESGAPMGYSRTRTPVKIEVIPGPNIYTYSNANGEEVTQVGGTPPGKHFQYEAGRNY